MNPYSIGIDLGTTYSCCGIYRNNKVELVTYNSTEKTIPSVVYFNPTNEEVVVGRGAKYDTEAALSHVYNSKRLIGREYYDPVIQNDFEHWPFEIVNVDDKPQYKVKYNCEVTYKSPVEVSSEILKWIKTYADSFLGVEHSRCRKTKAVITVPAYFTNEQKMETKKAAIEAGLEVIQLINEPTAAAMAYTNQLISQKSKRKDEETLLVYDFGGGTFDVSIIKVLYKEKRINVLAADGDGHLGGEDIDQKITEYLLNEYLRVKGRDYLPRDTTKRNKKITKMKKVVEESKILLSNKCDVIVDWYDDDDDDNEAIKDRKIKTLTRALFDRICSDMFRRTIEIVDNAMESANLHDYDIDRVVLVGGSSRIIKVQEMLGKKFGSYKICKDINPDEIVAIGATIYANRDEFQFKVSDVIPHSIFTDVWENDERTYKEIIKKNTAIPLNDPPSLKFATYEDNQNNIDITLYEGDEKNELISQPFYIDENHPNNIARRYKIKCTFNVDENGLLKLTAEDLQTYNTMDLEFNLSTRSY